MSRRPVNIIGTGTTIILLEKDFNISNERCGAVKREWTGVERCHNNQVFNVYRLYFKKLTRTSRHPLLVNVLLVSCYANAYANTHGKL